MQPVGFGCVTSLLFEPAMFTNNEPTIGNADFQVEATAMPPGTVGLAIFGVDPLWTSFHVPGTPTGCQLHTDFVATAVAIAGTGNQQASHATGASGHMWLDFPIPANASLAGTVIGAQFAGLDAAAAFPAAIRVDQRSAIHAAIVAATPSAFRAAALAVVDGDEAALRSLLQQHAGLERERSSQPHGATLLHYVAANGVENELQRTPANAVAIGALLLAKGAEPDALLSPGGDHWAHTPLCLLVSSYHPFARGLQPALVQLLVRGGAAIDGVRGCGMPLATALVFGYSTAAATLAAEGADTGNVLFAAGLGDGDRMLRYFDGRGALRAGALGSYQPPVPRAPHQSSMDVVQEAFHLAVSHGHEHVAGLLLQRGADVGGCTDGHHCQLPLVQAVFLRRAAMVAWLLSRRADANVVDRKLGQSAVELARAIDARDLVELLDR